MRPNGTCATVEDGLRENVHKLAVDHAREKLRADCAEARVSALVSALREFLERDEVKTPEQREEIRELLGDEDTEDEEDCTVCGGPCACEREETIP